jgi:hypothetical protein
MPTLKLTAIKPPKMPTGDEYAKAMKKAVDKSAGLVLKDLESTVRTWVTKVVFDVTITQQGDDYGVTAGTDNQIYAWVNDGTKKHVIRPKRSPYLVFSSGYKAKTRVGIIGSQEGGSFGGDVFSRRAINHPGFPGRKFVDRIQQRRQVTVAQEISQSIAVIARKQGS